MLSRRLVGSILAAICQFASVACSCIGEQDVRSAKKQADGVFIGTVVRSERLPMHPRDDMPFFQQYMMRFTVLVERSFKGRTFRTNAPTDSVIIYTGEGGGDCGFQFKIGERYIIYGVENDEVRKQWMADKPLFRRGIYWTNICMRTRPYEEEEVKTLEALSR